ncbi:uncharacterized protein PAC_12934 [Phialocephala subalpina]|uniref:Uncharacterized protein n=1 Tax=Phialocephala subalpina TaxID=576137 RepID=A0A1L7XDJ5_9HELO|nr:uncharacterized protein PAC_12934 [Phialocephala subalpina]
MLVQKFPESIKPDGMFTKIYRRQTKVSIGERLRRFVTRKDNESLNHAPSITEEDEFLIREKLQSEAPNLSLNVPGVIATRAEIWTLGAMGYVLQLGVLVAGGLSVYWFDWRLPNGVSVPAYSYPCFAAGTLVITILSTICGFIIEATTIKDIYEPIKIMDFDRGTQCPNMVFRVCKFYIIS